MKIATWVDFSREIEVDIDGQQVALAFQEAWGNVTHADDGMPKRDDIIRALGKLGTFLKALTDQMIADLNDKQRETVRKFLETETARWGGNLIEITGRENKLLVEVNSVTAQRDLAQDRLVAMCEHRWQCYGLKRDDGVTKWYVRDRNNRITDGWDTPEQAIDWAIASLRVTGGVQP